MKVYSAIYQDDAHLVKGLDGDLNVVYHPSQLKDKDSILILHGGADISPSIYNHKLSKYTHASTQPSERDKTEIELAKEAIKLGIPIFAICRGAQLMCALAGGSLIQHTDNHFGNHTVTTKDGQTFTTTSCHHQMLNLNNTEHDLIAWSAPSLSNFYIGEHEQHLDIEKEPELVFFPTVKTLAVQGHPEWMSPESDYVTYNINLIKERILSK